MPEKLSARLKCPFCQADLDLLVNQWGKCRKCGRSLMLSSPDRESGSPCFYVLLAPFILLILVYALRLLL